MAIKDFFIPRPNTPTIYAYSDTRFPGCLKVGYTSRTVAERMKEHYPTLTPSSSYTVIIEESAARPDGSCISDHDVHRILDTKGFLREHGEWFRCTAGDVKGAIYDALTNEIHTVQRNKNFKMRPEQRKAVEITSNYFNEWFSNEESSKTPHFLWNCKMRFGKTFTSYQLALEMGWKHILVLTYKPAVQSAWEEDLMTHVDFDGWQFISRTNMHVDDDEFDENKPFVAFYSLQDVLGRTKSGGIKVKNEWLHTLNWDCIILDEYHFGAWRERAQALYIGDIESVKSGNDNLKEYKEIEKEQEVEAENIYEVTITAEDEEIFPLTTDAYLYLSGTPFRAINTGEFIEEQIFNWTYSDEQVAKSKWKESEKNPYSSLPRMVLMTYQLSDELENIAAGGEFDSFSLNEFF